MVHARIARRCWATAVLSSSTRSPALAESQWQGAHHSNLSEARGRHTKSLRRVRWQTLIAYDIVWGSCRMRQALGVKNTAYSAGSAHDLALGGNYAIGAPGAEPKHNTGRHVWDRIERCTPPLGQRQHDNSAHSREERR